MLNNTTKDKPPHYGHYPPYAAVCRFRRQAGRPDLESGGIRGNMLTRRFGFVPPYTNGYSNVRMSDEETAKRLVAEFFGEMFKKEKKQNFALAEYIEQGAGAVSGRRNRIILEQREGERSLVGSVPPLLSCLLKLYQKVGAIW